MTKEEMVTWLEECAVYFERRDTGGEDMAFWSNVYNAENARKIARYLDICEGVMTDLPRPDVTVVSSESGGYTKIDVNIKRGDSGRPYEANGASRDGAVKDVVEKVLADPY